MKDKRKHHDTVDESSFEQKICVIVHQPPWLREKTGPMLLDLMVDRQNTDGFKNVADLTIHNIYIYMCVCVCHTYTHISMCVCVHNS